MRNPLILCYHAVSSRWPCDLAVPEHLVEEQLGLLAGRGFVGATLSDAERQARDGSLSPRTLVVTFDDGYASTLRAESILRRHRFPGTVFVVTGFAESREPFSWRGVESWTAGPHRDELLPLAWDELEELAARGWEIGSHTVSHPLLPELSDDRLEHELRQSRETIAERLGHCHTLAYPYGVADARVAAAAAAAGYRAAVTLTGAHLRDTPHERPRVGLYPADTGLRLRAKLSTPFDSFRRTSIAGAAARARGALGDR